MAIVPMEHIDLCAMKRDRKQILDFLQLRGVVEVENLPAADESFVNQDTGSQCAQFEKRAETATQAAELVKPYAPSPRGGLAFLHGRTAITPQMSADFYDRLEDVLHCANRALLLEREIAEAKAEVARREAQEEALQPWMSLPVPQTFTETKKTWVFIGSLDGDRTLEDILTALAETGKDTGPLHLEIISKTGSTTNFLLIALKTHAARTEDALRAIGFARPAGSTFEMPAERKKSLEQKRAAAQKRAEEAQTELEGMGGHYEDLLLFADHCRIRSEKYAVIQNLSQSNHVFFLRGYVPARAAEKLCNELRDKFTCDVVTSPVADGEEAPMLLQNNRFSEPTESVLEAYSLPGKGELDPVNVMSIFYYVMFGMMFSDAGYGLIMAAVCGICLLKFKNMDYNWVKNLRMFFWCGVSTVFWGIMFSSYFGDAVAVFSNLVTGHTVSIPPLWFDPLSDPMRLLMFCLLIGIIHLTTGYVMKGIQCWKYGSKVEVIYETVFPVVILYPLVLALMGTTIFEGLAGFRLSLPPIVTPVCIAISGICAVGIILTGGRESKNWVKRILKGLFALYNTLAGWLSDTLSYSRLLALGLATGVIASVMNQLGAMGKGMGVILGTLMFLVVYAVGQALNFGIKVLGAYVHSNRLEFVEFFGKFYEGGGRKFAPLGIHTKHYKIEEETQNG